MEKKHLDYFSCKKIKVTFLLAVLVFFIHISTLSNYDLGDGLGKIITNFHNLILVLSQVAVPMFFIISGVLFYRNYMPSKTLEKYKSRFFSLVIPYLFWNTVCMLFDIVCSYTSISKFFVGRQKFKLSVLNIMAGIFFYKCTPFWFIFNLIIFVILCPLIHTLLKNKTIGIMFIATMYILSIFNIGLPESIFFSRESIIYYCVGAYIGMHYFNWFYNKANKKFALSSLLISIICYLMLALDGKLLDIQYVKAIILIIFSISIWYAFDLLKNDYCYEYQKESFLIYAMHINVSALFTKVVYLILPKTTLMAIFNYVTTIIFTISIICVFGVFVGKKFPKIKKIIAGR